MKVTTGELRWVLRKTENGHTVKVLQQQWSINTADILQPLQLVWEDVPIEEEE